MPATDTLLQVSALLGRGAMLRALARRLLPGIAMLLVLCIVAGIGAVALLLALLYLLHHWLIAQGWEAVSALMMTCAVALLLELMLVAAIMQHFRRLEGMLSGGGTISSRLGEIGDAFMQGFKASPPK